MTMERRREEENASRVVDLLERRLTHTLESAPCVTIADDFAARVMAQVPARRTIRYTIPTRASIGRRIAMTATALLFVALFVFARQSDRMNAVVRDAAIWAVVAEFIFLTVWISLRPNQTR